MISFFCLAWNLNKIKIMKFVKIYIWFLFVALVGGAPVKGLAEGTGGNDDYVINLVNQIREAPLSHAEKLGYNSQEILNALPWLSDIENGLPKVSPSDTLNQRAVSLNTDARTVNDNPYIQGVDLTSDEMNSVDTVNTVYASQGDIGGVVAFKNFMDPLTAIEIIVNSQFKKELDPGYDGKQILLSPDYKLIGSSLVADRINVDGRLRNAFFVDICLASSLLKSEVQIVNMINQVRANPSDASVYLPVNLGFIPVEGVSPLFFNTALESAAKTVLYDEVDVLAHALDFGFPTSEVGYTAALEIFSKSTDDSLVFRIFSSLMIREVLAYTQRDVIFSPSWRNVGPALSAVGNESNDSVKVSIVTGGRTPANDQVEEEGLFRIYGVLFTDTDLNGVYTPGEEIADRLISVYDNHSNIRVRTTYSNKAGHFSFKLSGNTEYNIETVIDGERSGQLVVSNSDRYLNLIVKQEKDNSN